MHQQPDLEECIQRAFQKFANDLYFKGGFILSFQELHFDLSSRSLYLKPNIGEKKI